MTVPDLETAEKKQDHQRRCLQTLQKNIVKVIDVKKNGCNQELDIMMGQKIDFAISSPPASRPSYSGSATSGTPSLSNLAPGGDVARLISKIVAYELT